MFLHINYYICKYTYTHIIISYYTHLSQDRCVDQTNVCPEGYYDNTASSSLSNIAMVVCQPCHDLCSVCTSASDCSACKFAFITATLGSNNVQCLESCDITSATSPCGNCDPQCNGCTGKKYS